MTDRPLIATAPTAPTAPGRRARPAWVLARGGPATAGPGDPLVGLLAHLRVAVRRYARGRRAGGACPEQMRVELQELAAEALAAAGEDDPAVARVLTRRVVRWGLAAYHATAARQ